ncbi:MAG: hypothetical protein C3F06_14275 [Candidatus Methanoperedenaceae archaeon]|nr:MAG: hypothetical protein C3F06_14275 [Candidatus Methanoperedenaceae archaeon]
MATIIISDLHNRVDWVEPALSLLKPYDNVIFLGDYFDDFNDTPEDAANSAKWLKQSLSRPNRIHLCGTHDIWYRFPDNQYIQASGNTEEKSDAINQIITEKDWGLLQLFHYEQGFLFTHAGVHSYFIKKFAFENKISMQGEIIDKILKPATQKALMDISNNRPNEWLAAGFARGGMQAVGGITWLDWDDEFEPVPELNQIVGHTQMKYPGEKSMQNSKNYCLDTKNKHLGVLENGIFSYIENNSRL